MMRIQNTEYRIEGIDLGSSPFAKASEDKWILDLGNSFLFAFSKIKDLRSKILATEGSV